jgi:hypothetical protein
MAWSFAGRKHGTEHDPRIALAYAAKIEPLIGQPSFVQPQLFNWWNETECIPLTEYFPFRAGIPLSFMDNFIKPDMFKWDSTTGVTMGVIRRRLGGAIITAQILTAWRAALSSRHNITSTAQKICSLPLVIPG